MKIELFHDIVCPWCRIGKKNLFDAIKEWQGEPIDVEWRSYLLDPTIPTEGTDYRSTMVKKMGGAERLEEIFGYTAEAGARVGVRFNFHQLTIMPNSRICHEAIYLTPDEKKTEFVDAIQREYFENNVDVGHIDQLLKIAADLGIDLSREALLNHETLPQVQNDLGKAAAIGVTGVPFFVIDEKYGISGARSKEDFLSIFERVVESRS